MCAACRVHGFLAGALEAGSFLPSVPAAALSPSRVPFLCLCTVKAIASRCHWCVFCDAFMVGLRLLPVLPSHIPRTDIANHPDEGLRIYLTTALQAITVDYKDLGTG